MTIKNLETFYMDKRQGEVVNAVGSVVYYEKWKATRNQVLLESIRAYNEEDCRSTYLLRQWLLQIMPPEVKRKVEEAGADNETQASTKNIDQVSEYEAMLQQVVDSLTIDLPGDQMAWSETTTCASAPLICSISIAGPTNPAGGRCFPGGKPRLKISLKIRNASPASPGYLENFPVRRDAHGCAPISFPNRNTSCLSENPAPASIMVRR